MISSAPAFPPPCAPPSSFSRRGLVIAASLVVLLATTVRGEEPADARGITFFENKIRPLLALRCYECHAESTGVAEGGLVLDQRTGWMNGGESGSSVVPGDVAASQLIAAVRYDTPNLQMPPSQALPDAEVALLEQWVRMGAPAPANSEGSSLAHPADPEAGKSHWAYRSLQRPAPPEVRDARWPATPLDRFVLARLEQEGMTPGPDASPRDLVRRVYVLLTGLPPTAEQVASFLRDEKPEALSRLVDRLLSSPAFGERWGRHWLDLARYADSNGLDENFLFREAWRYRNWVIAAANADMPFDRFVLHQLAGDLLPFESIAERDSQRIATGFLVIGPKVLLGVEPARQQMEVADELIDTVGRAVLGQTVGCARCHDHKFDPIPTRDYYALAGIMTSTKVMERRWMLGQQRVMERLVGLGADGEAADTAYEKYWRERPQLQSRIETAKAILAALEKEDSATLASLLEQEAAAYAEPARDAALPLDQRVAAQQQWLKTLETKFNSPPAIPPRAMIPRDIEAPADEAIRQAGQFDRLGDTVPRGFLQVLCDQDAGQVTGQGSGRVELGRWLTDAEGRAGQLAARVQANRIWHHLIGRGLVRTVDNFGRTGEPPSHPELLDYLASELIDSGWSRKALIRQIVLSRTFALGSAHDAPHHERDPDNRLLWRGHRRRLGPEALRDAMRAAAGQLDRRPMDSTVWYLGDQATAVGANKVRRRTDFPCRSVYLPVIRNDLPELFDVFDFANPHTTTGARNETTVPTQALFILNEEKVMDAANATAQRVLAEIPQGQRAARIERMFALIFAVPPSDGERRAVERFLQETIQRLQSQGEAEAERQAWTMACHALFAASRFQYLE